MREPDIDFIDDHHSQILDLYENQWNKLSDKYFKTEPWPTTEALEEEGLDFCDEFRILYTELYYRHIFDKVGIKPSKDHDPHFDKYLYFEKYKSWENYVDLFNLLINTQDVPEWSLPSQWLWDIMDEFIYQFSQYRQFRSKLQNKLGIELEFLRNHDGTLWGIHSVLNVMHSIVEKSNIVESLNQYVVKNGQKNKNLKVGQIENQFAESQMYKYLGYCSLIGLLRFHVITGDYQLAIDSIKSNPIDLLYDLEDNGWFITTHYYFGFALVMTKRYKEAIVRFQNALNFIERTNRAGPQRQIQYKIDQQNKQVEHLYHLLAICVTLYPMQLETSIESKMREKVGEEKLSRMQDGDTKVFDDIFSKASPKFVPLGSPALDSGKSVNFANANLQKKVFMDEIRSQRQIPAIREYLKLYTTMELSKLSSFLSKSQGFSKEHSSSDDNATLSYLMCCKVKMAVASGEDFNKTCPSNSAVLSGADTEEKNEENDESQNSTDNDQSITEENGPNVDFYVDGHMVHIADTKVVWTYGRSYLKLIEQYRKIEVQANNLGRD